MKNFIDKLFYGLIEDIKSKSQEEIYNHMLIKFITLPIDRIIAIQNFLNQFEYWGKIEVQNKNFEMLKLKSIIFYKNIQDYIWLYENLSDYKSKYILFAILNNFYNFDFDSLKNCMENIYKHYFDLDIMPNRNNDVFVDVGAFTGDSCLDYIKSFGDNSYKKIYCYEICKENIEKMKHNLKNYKNIEIKELAVSDKNGKAYFDLNVELSANKLSKNGQNFIKSVKLDNDIIEKIDIVKMDIEGGEKSALKGMKKHIEVDNPTLLISVYHNNTDLFEIPKIILNYNKNYKFYLRYYGGCYFATEIVLIAIPYIK